MLRSTGYARYDNRTTQPYIYLCGRPGFREQPLRRKISHIRRRINRRPRTVDRKMRHRDPNVRIAFVNAGPAPPAPQGATCINAAA